MLQLNIQNETSRLRAVVLGSAVSNGPTPTSEQCYDPKSREHVLAGTYPKEKDMMLEMEAVAQVLENMMSKSFAQKLLKNTIKFFSTLLLLLKTSSLKQIFFLIEIEKY